MEWDSVLLWVVGMSCGMTALAAMRARPLLRGYLIASIVVAAITAGAYWKLPAYAGEIGGVLWGLFLLAPGLVQRRASRHSVRQDFQRSSKWMTAAAVLHPADGFPQQARLLRALHRAEIEELPENALAELDRLVARSPFRIARSARLHRARLTHDWDSALVWVAAHVPAAQLQADPALLGLYVRGLGEQGAVADMLAVTASARMPVHPLLAPARATVRLIALAFAGQVGTVERLLSNELRELPAPNKAMWLATAECAAGDMQTGQRRLTESAEDASTRTGPRAMLLHRLRHSTELASRQLTPAGRAAVHHIIADIDHEDRFSPTLRAMGRPIATIGLIVANVVMFVVEMQQGGATDDATLYRLGAMVPQAVHDRQYYRLFMANFLHFGTAHIVMNMLGLWVLGPFVEFSLGRVKYLLVYLLAGVATMASVGALMTYRGEDDILIGASGAIMALIGATAAVLLRGWWRGRAKVAARRLRTVGLILALQVVFDHFNPQVSGSAHLIGAAWGFVLASVLPHRKSRIAM